jgi:hypothetical protein
MRAEFVGLQLLLNCSSDNLPQLAQMASLPRAILTNAVVLELNTLAVAQRLPKNTTLLAELVLSSSVVLQSGMTVRAVRGSMQRLEEAYKKTTKSKQYWTKLDEVIRVPTRLALHRMCRHSRTMRLS